MKVLKGIVVFLSCFVITASIAGCAHASGTPKVEKAGFLLSGTDNGALDGKESVVGPKEIIEYVENTENGLVQQKKIGDVSYFLQFRPSEYIVCKEGFINDFKSKDSLTKEINEINEMQYYHFRIKINDFADEFLKFNMSASELYDNRVTYFSFEMQRDLKLVDGSDTLPCSMFHFERTYNISPYGSFILGFSNPNRGKSVSKNFIYEDRYLGTGAVKFFFDTKTLNNIPKLSLLEP